MQSRLEDVEQQIWGANTAVKLHVARLKNEHIDVGWTEIAALALVCGRIEQVQSELQMSIAELLALARKRLAGGATEGEETDTEDEGDAMLAGEESQDEVVVKVEQQGESEEKLEPSGDTDEERHGLEDREAKEGCGEGESIGDGSMEDDDRRVVDNGDDAGVDMKREVADYEDASGVVEMASNGGDEDAPASIAEVVETSCGNKEYAIEGSETEMMKSVDSPTAEEPDSKCREDEAAAGSTASHVELEDSAAVPINSAPAPEETIDQHENENDTVAVVSESTVESSRSHEVNSIEGTEMVGAIVQVEPASAKAKETFKKAKGENGSGSPMHGSENGKAFMNPGELDGFPLKRMEMTKQWTDGVASLTSTSLRHSLYSGSGNIEAIAAVNDSTARFILAAIRCDPKLNCRLWVERMVKTIKANVSMTKRPDLLQTFANLRESCRKLQQYSADQYTDYLQDMLYTVDSIEYLQRRGELDTAGLTSSVRFLMDQLREDCIEYYSNQNAGTSAPRTDRQWGQLALSCERLATFVTRVPSAHEQFPPEFLTGTIQILGAFDARFPKRMPVRLFENIISVLQTTRTKQSSTATVHNTEGASLPSETIAYVDPTTGAEMAPKPSRAEACEVEVRHSAQQLTDEAETARDNAVCPQGESADLADALAQDEKAMEARLKTLKRLATSTTNTCWDSVRAGNCTAEIVVNFKVVFADITAAVMVHHPRHFQRIWIEKMITACNSIMDSVGTPELNEELAPLKTNCSQLQQFCRAHYPDYLQDMLKDVQLVDNIQRKRSVNSIECIRVLRQLADQLRHDCFNYYQAHKTKSCEARSEVKWGQLARICSRLAGWMKDHSVAEAILPGVNFQHTATLLSAFDTRFPTKIPAELLECLKCPTQGKESTSADSNSKRKLDSCEALAIRDNCCQTKRSRLVSGDTASKPIQTTDQGTFDTLQSVVTRFFGAASTAKTLVIDQGKPVTGPTENAVMSLKATTTAANNALYAALMGDGNPDEDTIVRFSCATDFMARVICIVPGHIVEYQWLSQAITDLRQISLVESCTALTNERHSLAFSLANLEAFLRTTYVLEADDVPVLDTMESRVERFQSGGAKAAMRAIQSVSDGLLKDMKALTEMNGKMTFCVRSEANWSRFAAVGSFLSWKMRQLLDTKTNLHCRFFIGMLSELREFDTKYPGRLASSLLRSTKALTVPASRQQRGRKLTSVRQAKGFGELGPSSQ